MRVIGAGGEEGAVKIAEGGEGGAKIIEGGGGGDGGEGAERGESSLEECSRGDIHSSLVTLMLSLEKEGTMSKPGGEVAA